MCRFYFKCEFFFPLPNNNNNNNNNNNIKISFVRLCEGKCGGFESDCGRSGGVFVSNNSNNNETFGVSRKELVS